MKTTWLLPFLLVLSFPGWSQTLTLSLTQKRATIDSMITNWYKHGIFNGSILITHRNKIIYQRSAGYTNFETGSLHTDTTRFNLASVSKPFTACHSSANAAKKAKID